MTAKVIPWGGVTRLDSEPNRVLDDSRHLASIVVIGFDADGEEYFASSIADGGTVLWLIERAKMKLLAIPERLA